MEKMFPLIDLLKFSHFNVAVRKRNRIIRQEQSLFSQEPSDSEQKLIHDMFVTSIDMKNLIFNKRILPSGAVWMEDATISNIIFSHPEDRKDIKSVCMYWGELVLFNVNPSR